MSGKNAVVIGASGLVGSALVKLLLEDDRCSKVVSFARRAKSPKHDKLEERVVDFDNHLSWQSDVKGDMAFSSLGTTIKQAGSKDAQYKVDYTYQFEFAKAVAKNGIPSYALVSSASASAKSSMFYSRIKGELDRDVQTLGIARVRIFRPSLLLGARENERLGEKLSAPLLAAASAIGIARKWRGITGDTV
ncbi:MAG: NAD-dependent epimerase/dehydratase family protein, partial [Polyangiaceae bacterium]